MNTSTSFIRFFFLLVCVLCSTSYVSTSVFDSFGFSSVVIGVSSGVCFALFLMALEALFSEINLKNFNLIALGCAIGFFMTHAVVSAFSFLSNLSNFSLAPSTFSVIQAGIFLACTYAGIILVLRSSEDFYLAIPFVRIKKAAEKKKDLLIDSSVLYDSRIIDLAASGLLDDQLILPRFILKELQHGSESFDESTKLKNKRALEVVKKLESISGLHLKISDQEMPSQDSASKLIRLAEHLEANIITADLNRFPINGQTNTRIINLQQPASILKPVTQAGDQLLIKVQRFGKEPRQGVGYLEDGTMVVVNGGAEYLGETIKAHVLSVKHTASGRMIFCNALEDFKSEEIHLTDPLEELEELSFKKRDSSAGEWQEPCRQPIDSFANSPLNSRDCVRASNQTSAKSYFTT